jgi:hypothetical protein
MKGTVNSTTTSGVKIRTGMSAIPETDTGKKLFPGDRVYGTVLGNWIAFTDVYRNDGTVEDLGGTRYAAVANPTNLSEKYLTLTNEPEPPVPDPDPQPSVLPTLEISIGGDGYETVNVELKPKV